MNRHVSTTSQLVAHVESDARVRDRFMRHFAMNSSELKTYMRSLRVTRLSSDGVYTVYLARPNGSIEAKPRFLKKGTLVFAEPDGTPVILVECGNPLARGPNQPLVAGRAGGLAERVEAQLVPMPTQAPLIEQTFIAGLVQPDVPPPVVVAAPATPPTPAEISTGGEGGGQVLPAAGLALLPALFFIGGGGGGSAPIPEPATMIALGAGVTAFMLRRRAKK